MRNRYRTLFEVYSENIQSVAPSSILDKIDTDVAYMKAIKVTNQWSLDFIKYKEYYKKYLINRAKKENFFDNENRINVDDMWEVYSDSTEERMREELIDYVGDEAVDRVIDQEQIDEEVDDNFYKDFQANYLPEIKAEYEKKYNDIIMKPSKELGIDIDIEEAYQQIVSESRDPSDSPDLVKLSRGAVVRLCDRILGIKNARVVNDIIKYLEEVVGPSLSYDGYASGVMQRYVSKYINKNAGSGFYLDQHLYDNMNLEHGYWPPRIKKAIVDSFKQMFKEYTAWKKTQEVLKKGSKEAGMEIDIEESNEPYSDLNSSYIIFPYFKVIHNWKDKDEFTEWLYKEIDIKPDMFGSESKNWTHAQMVAIYFDDACDQTRQYYYKVIADDDEVDRKVYEDTLKVLKEYYKDFKQWKKTQEVLKKGSKEAGMEIDIEEAFSWDDYNYDFGGFKLTDKIKDWKHIDLFYKWLYLNLVNDPSFNSSRWLMYPEELDNITKKLNYYYEHEYHLNMLRVAPLHVKDYISNSIAGYHLRGIYVKVKNKFPEVAKDAEKVTIDHIKSLYDKWLKEEKIKNKTKRIIKKGSEKTGIDIDIEESNNSILLKRSNNEHDYGDIYSLVKHWEDGDMFIKWLSERTGDWPRCNKDNPLQEWWDNTVNRFSLLDPNRYNKKKRTVEDNIELALTSIEFFYDEFVNTDHYLKTKAAQDVLNKGLKETGIDI